ncbi:Arm DNA-binding domain-containing protein [Candidatus Nitrotoga arctica]|uniref:Integrase DNA-binding domain-containing protein n=1 Tax=Candidatus Nitrotoga arctica TaxID=453162 RepID=A0ABN8AKC3_9PROT|nr:Arm DNA-binding domain-containing protein [Candidatus Nitrotoga arctica]CAG9933189.1 protein of unknown function [Candidatus Nitrotoga arctica]
MAITGCFYPIEELIFTDTQIRNTQLEAKFIKLTGGGGLYIEVTPSGGKHWRYRFRLRLLGYNKNACSLSTNTRHQGRQNQMSASDARLLVKQGINPAQQRKLKP